MLTDFNNYHTYSISFPDVLFCLLTFFIFIMSCNLQCENIKNCFENLTHSGKLICVLYMSNRSLYVLVADHLLTSSVKQVLDLKEEQKILFLLHHALADKSFDSSVEIPDDLSLPIQNMDELLTSEKKLENVAQQSTLVSVSMIKCFVINLIDSKVQ